MRVCRMRCSGFFWRLNRTTFKRVPLVQWLQRRGCNQDVAGSSSLSFPQAFARSSVIIAALGTRHHVPRSGERGTTGKIRRCYCTVFLEKVDTKLMAETLLILYRLSNFFTVRFSSAFSALTLLVGRQERHPACKKTEWWGAGVVICLQRGADLHMAQLTPLPLTVSCSSKIQIGFTFLVPAYPGCPGKEAVTWLLLLLLLLSDFPVKMQAVAERTPIY